MPSMMVLMSLRVMVLISRAYSHLNGDGVSSWTLPSLSLVVLPARRHLNQALLAHVVCAMLQVFRFEVAF